MYTYSKALFEKAQQYIPGGVNSPVRAFKGVSVHVLAALAGHRNISTTMVYLHANATVLRAAVELI